MNHAELVFVTETAQEVGLGFGIFKSPVALTRKAWDYCVAWSERDSEIQDYQDQDARLWDVLFTCGGTISIKINDFMKTGLHRFSVVCLPRDGISKEAVSLSLTATPNMKTGVLVIDLE